MRDVLEWAFTDPEQLKPGLTRQTLTEQAAAEFARLAQRLRDRGHPSHAVAHFINRVLDPACGSGNFLYLALLALKDIEHRVAIEAETLGLAREFPRTGPEVVKGINLWSHPIRERGSFSFEIVPVER